METDQPVSGSELSPRDWASIRDSMSEAGIPEEFVREAEVQYKLGDLEYPQHNSSVDERDEDAIHVEKPSTSHIRSSQSPREPVKQMPVKVFEGNSVSLDDESPTGFERPIVSWPEKDGTTRAIFAHGVGILNKEGDLVRFVPYKNGER